MIKKPELMSPAGHWNELHAAIEAGADAVYFGLNHFSARAKVGFDLSELPTVMQTLHRRSVKGFVTFNTLVFDHELEQAETAIVEIAKAGVDAIIVQDVGIAQLAAQVAPDLHVHGSTQMSITSAQGVELAKSFGCQRVVLGRELSLTDIRKIASQTDVELEVFVHGALCVSYSGQCFSSEAWGGRSANRGKCAQACRLSYDLIVDGQRRELGDARFLLSPGDLYALEQIPELVEIGIACFKIEGRYKDANYVALTTKAYREAIDLACLNLPNKISAQERTDLEQIYSRGLGAHFISGVNHQTVVRGRAPRHRGVLVGKVVNLSDQHVDVQMTVPIQPGDGLVFDAADWRSPNEPEEGGNVYEVTTIRDQQVSLAFGHGEIDFSRIRMGDLVWRTRSPELDKRLKPLTKISAPRFTRPIDFKVTAHGGLPLEITATLESGISASYSGPHRLAPATNRPIDQDLLTSKLGRLGGTPFHLGQLELLSNDPVFAPTSELNQARRNLIDQLSHRLEQIAERPTQTCVRSVMQQMESSKETSNDLQTHQLHLLVRTPQQLEAAIEVSRSIQIASITLDYLELYGLRPSVEKIRAAGICPRAASPRILKPSEQNVIRFLLSLECDLLIRSGGLLHDLASSDNSCSHALMGDFSLNAANALTCQRFLDLGLTRITPSYDLNAVQIESLTRRVPCSSLEIIAYSHLPVFHTEHCVFCRFLSDGTDHTNCGHPCEKHQISVQDQQGRAHPVMADVGCRNTVFGAEAQVDIGALQKWRSVGLHHFRLEFVHQTPEQIIQIANSFDLFFKQQINAPQFAKKLAENSPQDTTQGSLFVPPDFRQLVPLK